MQIWKIAVGSASVESDPEGEYLLDDELDQCVGGHEPATRSAPQSTAQPWSTRRNLLKVDRTP